MSSADNAKGLRPAYSVVAMTRSITAIVVSFVDPFATARAVKSLVDQSLAPVEVLVADNNPREAHGGAWTADQISQRVRIVHSGSNLGYTNAANLAARQATGEWLFFLNPDAVAQADCLERLVEAADDPVVAVVGAQVLL